MDNTPQHILWLSETSNIEVFLFKMNFHGILWVSYTFPGVVKLPEDVR